MHERHRFYDNLARIGNWRTRTSHCEHNSNLSTLAHYIILPKAVHNVDCYVLAKPREYTYIFATNVGLMTINGAAKWMWNT